jgi:two-component system sensor histidine kinase MtrB
LSLRNILPLVSATLLALSLACAVALAQFTSQQHRAAEELARVFEKARVSGELRVDLLRLRDSEPGEKRDRIETRMHENTQALGRLVSTSSGQELATQANRAISRYAHGVGPKEGGPEAQSADLQEALRALQSIIAKSDAQAADALAEVGQWDHISDRIALVVGGALLLGVGAQMLWLWRAAFQPLSEVAGAMNRFATGERGTRARVRGPEEARRMARSFNEMADALAEQQNRQIAFVGGIAHDLRGPISAMRLGSAALRRGAAKPSEQALDRYLDLMERQTARLERMLGDFLDRTRVEAGKLELRREICDAREVALEAARPFEGLSAAHPVHLSLADEPVPVRCDRGRVEQVLTNLLSNAMKYSPGGGAVDLKVEAGGGFAVLNVTDRGVGIGASDLEKLFQPFSRVGGSRATPGVGLGLYVSRRIAEAHGGSLNAKSTLGEGSTFEVRLPMAAGGVGESLHACE